MKTIDELGGSPRTKSESYDAGSPFAGENSMGLYLRDISRVQLLTRQQENELAARIHKGDRNARDEMIKANLRLVVRIARDFAGIGVPMQDLISEGNIGLMKAVERFDPSKGAKMSVYGACWIKQAITRALASQSKAMRLPMHVVETLGKIRRAAFRFEEELGREPTDEELAAEVGTTPWRVAQMRMAGTSPVSLDAPVGGGVTASYADTVADPANESPCEKLQSETRTALLRDAMETLDSREQAVLRARFGLDGEAPKTLEETGQAMGISGERVRQMQVAALQKLRHRITDAENGVPAEAALRTAHPSRNGRRASSPARTRENRIGGNRRNGVLSCP